MDIDIHRYSKENCCSLPCWPGQNAVSWCLHCGYEYKYWGNASGKG